MSVSTNKPAIEAAEMQLAEAQQKCRELFAAELKHLLPLADRLRWRVSDERLNPDKPDFTVYDVRLDLGKQTLDLPDLRELTPKVGAWAYWDDLADRLDPMWRLTDEARERRVFKTLHSRFCIKDRAMLDEVGFLVAGIIRHAPPGQREVRLYAPSDRLFAA